MKRFRRNGVLKAKPYFSISKRRMWEEVIRGDCDQKQNHYVGENFATSFEPLIQLAGCSAKIRCIYKRKLIFSDERAERDSALSHNAHTACVHYTDGSVWLRHPAVSSVELAVSSAELAVRGSGGMRKKSGGRGIEKGHVTRPSWNSNLVLVSDPFLLHRKEAPPSGIFVHT